MESRLDGPFNVTFNGLTDNHPLVTLLLDSELTNIWKMFAGLPVHIRHSKNHNPARFQQPVYAFKCLRDWLTNMLKNIAGDNEIIAAGMWSEPTEVISNNGA